jgi:hypothetical protein
LKRSNKMLPRSKFLLPPKQEFVETKQQILTSQVIFIT